jgi:hypothetical protein
MRPEGETLEGVLDRLAQFGPVQMWSFVFDGNKFKGEILPELERLKKAEVIRLIDLLVVRKDSTGAVATLTASDLDWEEASSFGAVIGALMGWGAGGAEGAATGAIAGAAEQHGRDRPGRARLGQAAPGGDRPSPGCGALERLAQDRRPDRARPRDGERRRSAGCDG